MMGIRDDAAIRLNRSVRCDLCDEWADFGCLHCYADLCMDHAEMHGNHPTAKVPDGPTEA